MAVFTRERIAGMVSEARAQRGRLAASGLVFLGILVAAWALLAPWTARENYRTLAVAALSEETRVLVLGTSHVDMGLDPRRIEVPAMNLSADICDFVCLEAVVAGHVDRLPGLELVLLEVDVVSLIYDTFATYQGDHRNFLDLAPSIDALRESWGRKARLRWDRALLYSSWVGPFLARQKFAPREILRAWREKREGPRQPLLAGHRSFDKVMTEENDGKAILAIHAEEGSLANVDRNVEALIRTLRFLRERDVGVVLVRFPHHRSYWENRPQSWDATYQRALGRVWREFGRDAFSYWDFERIPVFSDDEFRDGDHLNAKGSERFSAVVNGRVLEALPVRGSGGGQQSSSLPGGQERGAR